MRLFLFVWKNHNGEPYLIGLPIDYLLKRTLAIVKKTHRLFIHPETVSHAVISDEPFDISFFTSSETSIDTDEPSSDRFPRLLPSLMLG
jgi:hypothetical protein